MNHANRLMLGTHRGKPFMLIHPDAAAALDVAALIRSDVGDFWANLRTSPMQRPDALMVYNGYEDYMFPGGKGSNEVEVGMVKWLHILDGYGHIQYTPTDWQPASFDRCVLVDVVKG